MAGTLRGQKKSPVTAGTQLTGLRRTAFDHSPKVRCPVVPNSLKEQWKPNSIFPQMQALFLWLALVALSARAFAALANLLGCWDAAIRLYLRTAICDIPTMSFLVIRETEVLRRNVIDHTATGQVAGNLRRAAGATFADMANQLGLSRPYLCDLEHGKRRWNEARCMAWEQACANIVAARLQVPGSTPKSQ